MTHNTTQLVTGHLNSFSLSCGYLSIAAKRHTNAACLAGVTSVTRTWRRQARPSLKLRKFCALALH